MDFLKILKSFEDFVYEALIWLILLPKTLLRIITRPRQMALYAEQELASADDERFGDVLTYGSAPVDAALDEFAVPAADATAPDDDRPAPAP